MNVAVAKDQPDRFFSCSPCPGILFGGYDAKYTTNVQIQAVERPGLFIGLMLSGRSTSVGIDGVGELHIPVGRVISVGFREETTCTNSYRAGEFCAGIGIHIDFTALPEKLAQPLDRVIAFLKDRYEGTSDLEVLPVSTELNALAEQALAESQDAPFRDLELEAILFSFLARVCRAMESDGPLYLQGDLSVRERMRVALVTEYLRTNLEGAPSLAELSRLAGVNAGTLADNFKTAHGQTIFSFYRSLRLDAARRILRCEGASITETGMRVGFSSPTAFATAYRRRFGHPPSQEIAEKT